MHIKSLRLLLFFILPLLPGATFSADTPSLVAVPPGRYMLIMRESPSTNHAPRPILVHVKAGPNGAMSIEPENNTADASVIQPQGNSVIFSIRTPDKSLTPDDGISFPMHVLSFAVKGGEQPPGIISGVFSGFTIFAQQHATAPLVLSGTFALHPIDAK